MPDHKVIGETQSYIISAAIIRRSGSEYVSFKVVSKNGIGDREQLIPFELIRDYEQLAVRALARYS